MDWAKQLLDEIRNIPISEFVLEIWWYYANFKWYSYAIIYM